MSQEEFQSVIAALDDAPQIIAGLVGQVGQEKLRLKAPAGPWSVLEHVCHLRDLEREGYAVRINRMLSEETPMLPDIDGDKLAAERDYNGQNIAEALASFASARRQNVAAVRGLSPEERKREGMMESVGPVTVERLMLIMHQHDQEHIEEMRELSGRLAGR